MPLVFDIQQCLFQNFAWKVQKIFVWLFSWSWSIIWGLGEIQYCYNFAWNLPQRGSVIAIQLRYAKIVRFLGELEHVDENLRNPSMENISFYLYGNDDTTRFVRKCSDSAWKHARFEVTTDYFNGTLLEVFWPHISLPSKQRRLRYEAKFHVHSLSTKSSLQLVFIFFACGMFRKTKKEIQMILPMYCLGFVMLWKARLNERVYYVITINWLWAPGYDLLLGFCAPKTALFREMLLKVERGIARRGKSGNKASRRRVFRSFRSVKILQFLWEEHRCLSRFDRLGKAMKIFQSAGNSL